MGFSFSQSLFDLPPHSHRLAAFLFQKSQATPQPDDFSLFLGVHGRRLITLQDAGAYIAKLSKSEHEAPEWQAAMEAQILGAILWRAADVRPHRCHEGIEPTPRARVRPVAQETPEAGPLSVTEARARWSIGVPEL
jgi:hypothetical protein